MNINVFCDPITYECRAYDGDALLVRANAISICAFARELTSALGDAVRDKDTVIRFHGTRDDFDDLSASLARDGVCCPCEMDDEITLAGKLDEAEAIHRRIWSCGIDELKCSALEQAFDNASDRTLRVHVIAATSAGKSTLINAMLRRELLPSSMAAKTSIVTEIADSDDDAFVATCVRDMQESAPETIDARRMAQLNDDRTIDRIKVRGRLPFATHGELRLVMVDTPGTTNERDSRHRATTEREMTESPHALVICVLSGSDPGLLSEYASLRDIASKITRNRRSRIVFVLNKLDEYAREQVELGETNDPRKLAAKLARFADDLRANGFDDAIMLPVAARPALKIRTLLKDSSSDLSEMASATDSARNAMNDALNLVSLPMDAFAEYYERALPPSAYDAIMQRLDAARDAGDKRTQAEIKSGVPFLEAMIDAYLSRHAAPALIRNISDAFHEKGRPDECRASIDADVARERAALGEIEAEIAHHRDAIKMARAFVDERAATAASLDAIGDDVASSDSAWTKGMNDFISDEIAPKVSDGRIVKEDAVPLRRRFCERFSIETYCARLNADSERLLDGEASRHRAQLASLGIAVDFNFAPFDPNARSDRPDFSFHDELASARAHRINAKLRDVVFGSLIKFLASFFFDFKTMRQYISKDDFDRVIASYQSQIMGARDRCLAHITSERSRLAQSLAAAAERAEALAADEQAALERAKESRVDAASRLEHAVAMRAELDEICGGVARLASVFGEGAS